MVRDSFIPIFNCWLGCTAIVCNEIRYNTNSQTRWNNDWKRSLSLGFIKSEKTPLQTLLGYTRRHFDSRYFPEVAYFAFERLARRLLAAIKFDWFIHNCVRKSICRIKFNRPIGITKFLLILSWLVEQTLHYPTSKSSNATWMLSDKPIRWSVSNICKHSGNQIKF